MRWVSFLKAISVLFVYRNWSDLINPPIKSVMFKQNKIYPLGRYNTSGGVTDSRKSVSIVALARSTEEGTQVAENNGVTTQRCLDDKRIIGPIRALKAQDITASVNTRRSENKEVRERILMNGSILLRRQWNPERRIGLGWGALSQAKWR